MSLKLLALRIPNDFPAQKRLHSKILYKFSSDIIFSNKQKQSLDRVDDFREITTIRDKQTYPSDLYQISGFNNRKIDVNITAILGRNGSGKSSLLELLYLIIFCLAEQKYVLNFRRKLEKQKAKNPHIAKWQVIFDQIEATLKTTELELYYKKGDSLFLLKKSGAQNILYILKDEHWYRSDFKFEKLFYTICINYSQYGLNAAENYSWLTPLFHKNDGYKTPIVLNPYRDKGNININTELHLAQTRVLTNLSNEEFSSQSIIDDKSISNLTFFVRPAKLGFIEDIDIYEVYQKTLSENNIDLAEFFPLLVAYSNVRTLNTSRSAKSTQFLKRWFNSKSPGELGKTINTTNPSLTKEILSNYVCIYIITKLIKIINKYDDFNEFTTPYIEKTELKFRMVKNVKGLLNKITGDQSHVSLKLKQAINTYIHQQLFDLKWMEFQDEEYPEYWAYSSKLEFNKVKKIIVKSTEQTLLKEAILAQFVPVAFFNPSIEVTDGMRTFNFSELSSGEQQLIHSTHSILYHLINLDSRNDSAYPYTSVNLVLDEIELYYHPSYQRDFIKSLLENIERVGLKKIRHLNILFSTHSPFILSDIPHQNVLRLLEGLPYEAEQDNQTFGANIHDMLAGSFFLDEQLIGSYAEKTIEKCIAYLEQMRLFRRRELLDSSSQKSQNELEMITAINEQLKDLAVQAPFDSFESAVTEELKTRKIYRTIQLIGEPVVRFKIMEMYDELMPVTESEKQKAKREILELMKKNNLGFKDF
nr:AAA family ATPase [Pedobacter panaciterrae]